MVDEFQQSRMYLQEGRSIPVQRRAPLEEEGLAESHPDMPLCTQWSCVSQALVMWLIPGRVSSACGGTWSGFKLLNQSLWEAVYPLSHGIITLEA